MKVRIDRVLDGTAYASLVQPPAGTVYTPITAEAEAEKPTRAPRRKAATKPPVRVSEPGEEAPGEPGVPAATAEEPPGQKPKAKAKAKPKAKAELEPVVEEPVEEQPAAEEPLAEQKPKRKTRRGSRGGRGRKKRAGATAAASNGGEAEAAPAPVATIHVPAPELGAEDGARVDAEAAPADGAQPVKKKRTRRGSRGGRNRRKKATAAKPSADESS
jgi:ribonuclease E